MKTEEILENICVYDERSPYFDKYLSDDEINKIRNKKCYCDNCFYGRTKLANEILRLKESE